MLQWRRCCGRWRLRRCRSPSQRWTWRACRRRAGRTCPRSCRWSSSQHRARARYLSIYVLCYQNSSGNEQQGCWYTCDIYMICITKLPRHAGPHGQLPLLTNGTGWCRLWTGCCGVGAPVAASRNWLDPRASARRSCACSWPQSQHRCLWTLRAIRSA